MQINGNSVAVCLDSNDSNLQYFSLAVLSFLKHIQCSHDIMCLNNVERAMQISMDKSLLNNARLQLTV